MESEKFFSMLQQAINQKNTSISQYQNYAESAESADNKEMQQILEAIVEKKKSNLELLKNIEENTRNGMDIPEQLYSGPINNIEGEKGSFKQSLDLLMQLKTAESFRKQANPSSKRTIRSYSPKRFVFTR